MYPIFHSARWMLTVQSQSVTFNSFTAYKTIPLGIDIADGVWHFIVISWDLSGHTKIFIDSIKKVDQISIAEAALPKL